MSQPDITPPWEHGLSDEDHEAYYVGVREGQAIAENAERLKAALVTAFRTLGPSEVLRVMSEAMHQAAEETAPALAAQWAQRARDNRAENDEAGR